jgi:hypothetical protein
MTRDPENVNKCRSDFGGDRCFLSDGSKYPSQASPTYELLALSPFDGRPLTPVVATDVNTALAVAEI